MIVNTPAKQYKTGESTSFDSPYRNMNQLPVLTHKQCDSVGAPSGAQKVI